MKEDINELEDNNRRLRSALSKAEARIDRLSEQLDSLQTFERTNPMTHQPHEELVLQVQKLQDENKRLRTELDAFDVEFFEEIEDLKYKYSIARDQLRQYHSTFGPLQ